MHPLARSLVAVPVLLLGLAGCGSDDTDAPGTSSGASASGSSIAPDAVAPQDLCSLVTAAELSEALGATVTTEAGPTGDCEFDQEDPRALSGSVGVVEFADANGGYPAYLSGLDGSLKNPADHEVTGLGDAAVIKIGPSLMSSGGSLMAGGAVDHGSYLLQVTLVQSVEMTEEDLATAAENVLRLIDAKSS